MLIIHSDLGTYIMYFRNRDGMKYEGLKKLLNFVIILFWIKNKAQIKDFPF